MNQISLNSRLLHCLLAASLLAGPVTAAADTAAECRQEVQDYGIPPEQAQDYIDGCLLSRGGAQEADPGAAPPGDEGADPALFQGAGYTGEQVIDAGQPDAMLPGGSDGAY